MVDICIPSDNDIMPDMNPKVSKKTCVSRPDIERDGDDSVEDNDVGQEDEDGDDGGAPFP